MANHSIFYLKKRKCINLLANIPLTINIVVYEDMPNDFLRIIGTTLDEYFLWSNSIFCFK